MSNPPINYIDTPDKFTVAQRKSGVRLFAYADREWADEVITRNRLRDFFKRNVTDYVVVMDLQAILSITCGYLNKQCVVYEREAASFLGYATNVSRILKQAFITDVILFSDVPDNDEAVYLRKIAQNEQIPVEIVKHR
jgi:hypothetical protein